MVFLYVFIVLIALLILCILFGMRITRRGKPQPADSPAHYGLEFKEISFHAEDGVTLRGWWIPSDHSDRTIIFLHGYHGSLDYDLPLAPFFIQHGFNVMMFDFRGHNRSEGRCTTIGFLECKDAAAAIAFAQAQGSIRIGLLGFSMGGRVAIMTAAGDPRVNAIISDCAPARLSTAITNELVKRHIPRFIAAVFAFMAILGASLRCGVNLFIHEPIFQAEKLDGKPVLFIQGQKDPFITQDEFIQMTRHAGRDAHVWLVPEAGHCEIPQIRPDEYRSTVQDFFTKYLQS